MPHTHHAAVESFWASAVLILAALIYVRGWIRIRRLERDSVGGWRAAQFSPGTVPHLACSGFPYSGPRSPTANGPHDSAFAAHDAGPSFDLAWRANEAADAMVHPHRFIEAFLAPISHWAPMKRLGKSLANPTVCWLAAAATLIGWHIPSLFALGMRSELWHGIEQASFLISGVLFWWPVIRPGPSGFERVRVVDPFVSFSRHLAVRYPFRISCLLRPCGLPGLFLGTAPACVFCS